MFKLDDQIKKLGQLHDKIERMPNCKEKLLLMSNYTTYCFVLYNLFPEEEFPFDAKEFFQTEIFKKHQKYFMTEVTEIYDSSDTIRQLFTTVATINQEYHLTQEISMNDEINPQLGLLLVSEFFNTLPDSIQKIYHEVINKNLFFTQEGESMAYNTDYWNGSLVKCQAEFKKYYTYMAIAHEIGHCYQFRLNTQSNNFNFVRPDIEVPSIFMEIIFNNFADKYLYGQEFGINCLQYRQLMFANWLNYYEMFFANSEWLKIVGEKQLMGIINYQDLTENDKRLLSTDFNSLTIEDSQEQYFSLNTDISELRYPLSNLFAIYFADIYLQDQKEGLRLLKDYLMLPPNVTLEDKLTMYDLTGANYKKMIKKVSDYGKRKYLL